LAAPKVPDWVDHADHRPAGRLPPRTSLTVDDLKDPARYALVATGLADLVRAARLRNELTYADIERRTGVGEAMACKVEQAAAKVPLATAMKVALALGVDVHQALAPGPAAEPRPLFGPPPEAAPRPGSLSWQSVTLAADGASEPEVLLPGHGHRHASIIALEGEVMLEFRAAAPHSPFHLLTAGQVAHLQSDAGLASVRPLSAAKLLVLWV
jgi:transcriptional regulator with XRE-family HTH domain